jgi:molecular chaperone DnaK
VLVNRERLTLTPSVVARHRDGTLLVGSTAQRMGKTDPQNVIFSIKRLMGRRYKDAEVAKVQKHVSYRIVAPQDGGAGLASVMIGDKRYSPIEVSALILKKVKEDAEEALGATVTHAVITVPAYFDDNQREATRQAGTLAGLKVKRIIDEPTAAAYAFGMDLNMSDAKAVVVYDLGGGTFDISVIFIGSGIPTVEAIGGDIWLGGDRFDNAIIDFVISQYPGQRDALRKDAAFMLELKAQAEQAKKDIAGGAPSADVTILGVLRGKLDVEVTIRAEQFEGMIRQDIEGSLKAVDDTLADANMSVADIDHVLLVGGSTGLPLVRRLLVAKFGAERVKATVNPMECVALGAAILASRSEKKFCPKRKCSHENEADADECSACGADLSDVETRVKCPHCGELHAKHEVICPSAGKPLVGAAGGITAKPIGIRVEGSRKNGDLIDTDRFKIIVPKSTRYPTSEAMFQMFKTASDRQACIIVPIYQGLDPVATHNEFQCEIVIDIPEGKRVPDGTGVDVGFDIDENGLLTIKVKGKDELSWLDVGKLVRPWENGTSGANGNSVHPPEPEPKPDGDTDASPDWERDLNFYVNRANVAIRDFDWCLSPASIEALQALVSRADAILETGDEAAGLLISNEFASAMKKYCGGMPDLVDAAWIRRLGLGQLDQSQRLAGMLDEFRRRALQNESPRSAALAELRSNINQVTQEIFDGLGDKGKVLCRNCGGNRNPPTPASPKCEHCGDNPLGLRL